MKSCTRRLARPGEFERSRGEAFERSRDAEPIDQQTLSRPYHFPVFEVFVKKRGRAWKWSLCKTEGQVLMFGVEGTRPAARYKADRALLLMLLCAPYHLRRPGGRAIGYNKSGKSRSKS